MATNLFVDYPKIAYTLDDFESEQVVVDIFRRIVFKKEYIDNSSYYEEYEVLGGETPEELSYRFYGTTQLYWIILMVNGILDPRFDWPMAELDLYNYSKKKYGGENNVFSPSKAYNDAGYEVETNFILLEDATHKNPTKLLSQSSDINYINTPISWKEDNTISEFVSNFEIEQSRNEINRTIRILKPALVEEIVTQYKNSIKQ